ncbi:gluconokinase [Neorhizobium sp. IRS_2294]|uniref:gluconokinase n=1 Tax=unclassified Neorhizobium TaxID=2629175 RepID=UPI003D2DA8CA
MAASQSASDTGAGVGAVVVMGVSGCGKSSVGDGLARRIGANFIEGDSLHPAANAEKMRAGMALDDADRGPWLDALGQTLGGDSNVVVSCSALKRTYRDRLRALAGRPLVFVYLHGGREVLAARMAERCHDYMPLSLLDSQLATLDPPYGEDRVVTIEINQPLEAIVVSALEYLASSNGP